MRLIFAIGFILCFTLGFSTEMEVAQIADKDDYTNVRLGKGTHYEILGTIETGELFYCEVSTTSNWYKVIAMKWGKNGQQVIGYMHNSRVKIIKNLSLIQQNKLITTIVTTHKELAEAFRFALSNYDNKNDKWNTSKDSIEYKKARAKLESYADFKFAPILSVISTYICKTNNKEVLTLLFEALWADRGSADETPSFALGDCFICVPEIVSNLVREISNKEQKELIINHIDWGLRNHFNVDAVSVDKKYIKLNKILEKLK